MANVKIIVNKMCQKKTQDDIIKNQTKNLSFWLKNLSFESCIMRYMKIHTENF